MKELKAPFISIGLFLTLMFVTVNMAKANSTEPVLNATFAPTANSVIVTMENVNFQGTTLTIQDLDAFVLHRENINEEGIFSKKYNLKNLPANTYHIVIEDEISVLTQVIAIDKDGKVETISSEKSLKPNFAFVGDKLRVNFPQASANGYELNIFDFDGNTIFKESNVLTEPTERVYNLSKLEAGNYNAIVFQNGARYNYQLKLK